MCIRDRYTGVKNIASASLAREFGLNTAGIYRELVLPLNQTIRAEPVQGFEPVNADRACTLLGALRERNKGFLIFNRTFMHMGEPLYRGLAAEGKVYWDEQSGSVLVLGNRFLEKRSLQIGIMSGDYEKCLKFALYQAQQKGVPQLTEMCIRDRCRTADTAPPAQKNFEQEPYQESLQAVPKSKQRSPKTDCAVPEQQIQPLYWFPKMALPAAGAAWLLV